MAGVDGFSRLGRRKFATPRLKEINTKTGRAGLAFRADRQRVIESFRQADNRYFLQHCLQEILKRRLKVEVAAVESLTLELVPVVALEL